ncbi:MAG: cupin domain-containing protein [Thermomicrobiales bacterium]
MRRFAMVTLALVLALGAGLATTLTTGRLGALATKPLAANMGEQGGIEIAPGVTAQFLGQAPVAAVDGRTVYLIRVTVAPGGVIEAHRHPGTTLVSMESGMLTWTLQEGTAAAFRATADGTPVSMEQLTEPGAEVRLGPGDGVSYHQDTVHTGHNPGDEPAVFLDATVLESGQPLLLPPEAPASERAARVSPLRGDSPHHRRSSLASR